MNTPYKEDAQQVQLCLTGDSKAFEPLVQRYQNAAFATALGFVSDNQDAQDIVQDAFVAAYTKLGQLKQPEAFGQWLRQIVVNRCKRWLTKYRREAPVETAEALLETVANGRHHDQGQQTDLWDAVYRLSESHRTVLLMHYLSGFPYEDMATYMDLPVSTVKGRLYEARQQLKSLLTADEEGLFVKPEAVIGSSQVDIIEEVREEILQIATQPVRKTISMNGIDHMVVYCGIWSVHLTVCQAEGDEVVLEGTKSAAGLSPQTAQQCMNNIAIKTDMVDDYYTSGPHEGQCYAGMSFDEDSNPSADSMSVSDLWKHSWGKLPLKPFGPLMSETLYPVIRDEERALPEAVRDTWRSAIRLSIVSSVSNALTISPKDFSTEVKTVMPAMTRDSNRVHGPVEAAHLTLYVPKGKTITVFQARKVTASKLQANLNIIDSANVEVTDVTGHVFITNQRCGLFGCTIKRLDGQIVLRNYVYMGWGLHGDRVIRHTHAKCLVQRVRGLTDIDMHYMKIDATGLSGQVRIRNRYGPTRLTQKKWDPESRYQLITGSGEMKLVLPKSILEEAGFVTQTMCGSIWNKPILKRLNGSSFTSNAKHITYVTPGLSFDMAGIEQANFFLQSESGKLLIEQVKQIKKKK